MKWDNRMLLPSSMDATKRMNRMYIVMDKVEQKMLKDAEDIYDRSVSESDELRDLRIGDRVTVTSSAYSEIVSINGDDATVDVDMIDRAKGRVFGRLIGVPLSAVSKTNGLGVVPREEYE